LKTILIADLINAVSIGLIINPYFSTFTVATFPWILIPAVALPIALVLHGITLYRLRNWYQYKHAGNFQRLDASMQNRTKDYYKVLALIFTLILHKEKNAEG
jgi:hypothetical protein